MEERGCLLGFDVSGEEQAKGAMKCDREVEVEECDPIMRKY